MEEDLYRKKQEAWLLEYESLCKCCGECCGAYSSDPCANLIKIKDNTYRCGVYENRLGPQKTVSGKIFNCVPIRDVIKFGAFYNNCAYMKR